MIRTSTATTWGIESAHFLWAYGALWLAAAVAVGRHWLAVLGPRERLDGPLEELDLYDLATLSGGPGLAITSAAAQLHRDGLLRAGAAEGTLEVVGELDPAADPLEHAVFETVRAHPAITSDEMRAQVLGRETVQSMTDELTSSGLLLEHRSRMSLLRGLLLAAGLLVALGLARIVAGAANGNPVGLLAVMTGAIAYGSVRLAGRVPLATSRGRAMLTRWRKTHDDLRRNPVGGYSVLTAALFGAGALWLAAPEIASALGVPREQASGSGGGGGCGGGCGGCGGGCGG